MKRLINEMGAAVTIEVEDSDAHRVYIQKGEGSGLQGNPGAKCSFLFRQSTHATSLSLRHSPHRKQSRESVHRETY